MDLQCACLCCSMNLSLVSLNYGLKLIYLLDMVGIPRVLENEYAVCRSVCTQFLMCMIAK